MNTFTGSLQRKGRRYYLVLTTHGRQKWISLKTGNLRVARRRAAQVAPQDATDETDWLAQLVRLGDAARQRLDARKARVPVPWRKLWTAFRQRASAPISATSEASSRRWLEILAEAAPPHRAPVSLTAEDARRIVSDLCTRYVSTPRLIMFYRRVWRVLKWDETIWSLGPGGARTLGESLEHEFYRRLETDEVRRVIRHFLVRRNDSLAQAYADMVLLGYCTGLRLSDVAELERDEVTPDGRFLTLQPNKTRHSKRRLLRIPLIGCAQACIRRLLAAADDDSPFLFSARARHCPTKAICRAFRACGLHKRGSGRASFHSLRATFISLMDEAGVPPHVTDAITGHAGGGMHARYTQPSDAALAEAVARAIPPV